MDEQREAQDELAELDRDAADELREREAERRYWLDFERIYGLSDNV
jgi:hypothetical protein